MVKIIYAVQRPGDGPVILNAYRALAADLRFDRVTGLFAFASTKGAKLLSRALQQGTPEWNKISKRWVISIDGGITQPEALRYLLRQKKVEVRVPYAEELIRRRLRPFHRFHPKTMLLEVQANTLLPVAIVVGSANLTCNGLCFGHEHALVVHLANGKLAESLAAGIQDLDDVIDSATKIDEDFVDRYESIRPDAPSIPEDFEDQRTDRILEDNAVISPEESAALASAQNLWIEIENESKNRGRGNQGSQIDLKKGTRVFFGGTDKPLPKNTPVGTYRINYADHSALRNLRFGSNDMDKLDLPIPDKEGPPSYRNQTLLFAREADGVYRMILGTPEQISDWKRRSLKIGSLFQMRGGREYGVF